MFRYRLIFGPLMIALLMGVFYLDNRLDQVGISDSWLQSLFFGRTYLPAGLVMLFLVLALIPLGARELVTIFRAKGISADTAMVAWSGIVGCLSLYILPSSIDAQRAVAIFASIVILLFFVSLVKYSLRQKRTQGAVAVAGVTMFALIYMGFLPGFFILIRRWHSAWLILGIIATTKACDIGAYFTGRLLGRHKMIPWLSPGKTWEGLAGGVAASTLVAVGLVMLAQWLQGPDATGVQILGEFSKGPGQRVFTPQVYPLWAVAICGALFALVGQFGDLTASLFKRDAGIKDSASYIPGFGGVLDVVDSPLSVAPLAYWALVILPRLA